MHALKEWIMNNWRWLASSGLIAAIGTFILKGPEVLDKWGRIFRKIRGLPETPYPVSEEAFETDFILRFGFKFCAPKGWDRTDPYNSMARFILTLRMIQLAYAVLVAMW